MNWQPYITTTAEIAGGKPIVQGTRFTVEFVLGLFAAGCNGSQRSPLPLLAPAPARRSRCLRARGGMEHRCA